MAHLHITYFPVGASVIPGPKNAAPQGVQAAAQVSMPTCMQVVATDLPFKVLPDLRRGLNPTMCTVQCLLQGLQLLRRVQVLGQLQG